MIIEFINLIKSNSWLLTVLLGAVGILVCLWLSYNGSCDRRERGDDLWMESPLIKSEWLSNHIGNGTVVHLKLDALQPSGSFKIRGISAFMKGKFKLSKKNKINIDAFITTSSANAGMAACYTASKLNCKCIVILDETQKENELLSIMKNEYGAEIQFYGKTWNEADEYALELCAKSEYNHCYVPMFDDDAIFNGHSSIIGELAKELSDCDCIIVSVGGGGLITGILCGLLQVGWSRKCKIIAAQSENGQLFENGVKNAYKAIPTKTISSEGINLGFRAIAKKAMDMAYKYSKFNEIKSIIVNDLDVLNIATLFALKQHILIEPLCAVSIAALYKNKEYFKQFKNICIVVCGGNHIYFNTQLLHKSIKNGKFNAET